MCKVFLSAPVLLLTATPAFADLIVEQATIAGGQLHVIGRVSPPARVMVRLDEAYETRTERNGRFLFRLVYHPANCVVSLIAGKDLGRAVVKGCVERSPGGEAELPASVPPARQQSISPGRRVSPVYPAQSDRKGRRVSPVTRALKAPKGCRDQRARRVLAGLQAQ